MSSDSDDSAILEPRSKKPRHTIIIDNFYLFRNHLATKKVLRYIFENPDNDPENFQLPKNRRKHLKILFTKFTTHSNDGGGIFGK